MKAYAQHGVWRYWGRTLLASAVVRYQLRFRLDVNNLALVHIFNISNFMGFGYGRTFFKYPPQRQA